MPFQAATNHDNADGLTTVTPQPRCVGIQYAERRYSADNSANDHGYARTDWLYDFMTPSQFDTLRTLLGLSDTTPSAEATIRTIKNDHETFANYNVTALDPRPGEDYKFDGGKYINVVWRYRGLEALA